MTTDTRTKLGANTVKPTQTDSTRAPQRLGSWLASQASIPVSNPDFAAVNHKRRSPLVDSVSTTPIFRGFIKREKDASDPTSKYQLKFMYNPATIQRDYLAYLDQNAIDPYNSIYGAGNLVAPPGILHFSFDLVFDRQVEAASDPNSRGVLVDYEYFDRVIRAVEPSTSAPSTQPPDNGVFLVNPRDITVVFGPKLQATGRPYTASVTFEKFNHKMVPTRMRVNITMKVYSFNVLAKPLDFLANESEKQYEAAVTYDNRVKVDIEYFEPTFTTVDPATGVDYAEFDPGKLIEEIGEIGRQFDAANPSSGGGGAPGSGPSGGQVSKDASYNARMIALQEGYRIAKGGQVSYRPGGSSLDGMDSVGFVKYCYTKAGISGLIGTGRTSPLSTLLGPNQTPVQGVKTVEQLVSYVRKNPGTVRTWSSGDAGLKFLSKKLQDGDLLAAYKKSNSIDQVFMVGSVVGGGAVGANGLVFPTDVSGAKYNSSSFLSNRPPNSSGSQVDHLHAGIDITQRRGAPIYSVVSGRAAVVRRDSGKAGGGNYIVIEGDDGRSYTYMHMDGPSPILQESRVNRGQVIGYVGDSGSPGAVHLHFEIQNSVPHRFSGYDPRDADRIDPFPILEQIRAGAGGTTSSGEFTFDVLASQAARGPNIRKIPAVWAANYMNVWMRPSSDSGITPLW